MSSRSVFFLACFILTVLGTALLLTTLPFSDEGFYGVPAYFLATQGILKNPILETAGVPTMTGIHSLLYWMTPGAMLLQAAAFKLFGFSLYVQRGLSLAAALGTVVLWWRILSKLIDEPTAAVTCLLLSLDFVFTSLAVRGRADMLSLFFASLALATYLHWRERSLSKALLIANSCCAISGIVHPNGGIAGLVLLITTLVYFDRSRLRGKALLAGVVPYVLFAAIWAMWIARSPQYFAAQFLGNARNRVPKGPVAALAGEAHRYLLAFGAAGPAIAAHARVLIPLAYVVAVVGCLLLRPKVRGLNLLLIIAALQACALLFAEGSKQGWYLVSSMPVLDALLAVWLIYLWNRPAVWSRLVFSVHALVILAVALGLAVLAAKRHYQREYMPAIAFLNTHVVPQQTVFGRSELFYGMDCKACLMDDERLGARSGRTAAWIVVDLDYRENLGQDQQSDPITYRFIQNRLHTQYAEKFDDGAFEILQNLR